MSYSLRIGRANFAANIYDMIILDKLFIIELDARFRMEKVSQRLLAIQKLQKLLKQLDFLVEEVPLEDPNRLTRLLVSLKGEPLTEDEKRLVEELTGTYSKDIVGCSACG